MFNASIRPRRPDGKFIENNVNENEVVKEITEDLEADLEVELL